MSPITELIGSAKVYGWGSFSEPLPAFESIATATVTSAGASSVSFSNIPSTYTHLQIRGISKENETNDYPTGFAPFRIIINNSYATSGHGMYSNLAGTNALAYGYPSSQGNGVKVYGSYIPTGGNYANMYSASIIDFIDYANTSKNKTIRYFCGSNSNTLGPNNRAVAVGSGAWYSTSAITDIRIENTFIGFAVGATWSLYGIKG